MHAKSRKNQINVNAMFKTFLDNKHIIQEKMITVPKKPLFLVLPYIRQLQLETTAKSRKSFKGTLNCSKLQILFRVKANYQTLFILKDHLPKELTSGVIHKFH